MQTIEIKCETENLPPSLQNSIDNIIKKEGYITKDVYNRTMSTDGGNFLAMLYEIDVKGKTADGEKETNLFAKLIKPGEQLEGFFSITNAYLTETYFYTELSDIFTEIQDEAEIPIEERYRVVKNYDANSETIILENASKKGYTTCHRMNVIPLKFAELSVQQLAKFHGLSFVIQTTRPEYFDRKIKTRKGPWDLNDCWKATATNIINITLDNIDGQYRQAIEDYLPTFFDKLPKYLNGEESTKRCLCHGDYRHNNILMKETDGEISDVIPVDYQLLHYGCPINDLLYLIFIGTDRKFRRQHLINLKEMYYDTLEKFLQYFDIEVETVYPRGEFEKTLKEKLDYGLMLAIYFYPIIFVPDTDVPDFGKDNLEHLNFKPDPRFKERLIGVLDDFAEWGYIKK